MKTKFLDLPILFVFGMLVASVSGNIAIFMPKETRFIRLSESKCITDICIESKFLSGVIHFTVRAHSEMEHSPNVSQCVILTLSKLLMMRRFSEPLQE